MQVGAGLLGTLAVAASVAGTWLLGGLVLAALLAFAARRTPAEPGGRAGRLLDGLRAVSRLGRLVLFAVVFAAYALPAHRELGAAGFVAVVTAADVAGVRISAYWRRWCTGLLLVAAAAFVVLCAGIDPVARPEQAARPGVAGVLVAAAVTTPVFAGLNRRGLAAGLVASLAVAAAALYQLGPVRLGLSPTSLRDVLAAADAGMLDPVLGVVVVLATVPAALLALTGAREAAGLGAGLTVGAVVAGAAAALVAFALTPLGAVLVAAALALAETLAGVLLARRPCVRGYLAGALAAVLLGALVFAL